MNNFHKICAEHHIPTAANRRVLVDVINPYKIVNSKIDSEELLCKIYFNIHLICWSPMIYL